MRILLILFLISFPTGLLAQVYDRNTQTQLVKDTIGGIAARKKPKIELVTYGMRRLEGKLIGVYPDHFVILPKQQKALINIGAPTRPKYFHFKYRDILQLEAKGVALSFVPDPNIAPFSNFKEVSEKGVGIPMQIILVDGTRRYGVFLGDDEESIKVMRGNTQVETKKDRIAKIYMITGDTSSFSRKILAGAGKGMEITDDILPLFDPRANAHPLSLGIGAAMGALIYILPKRDGARVLIYAR